MEHIFCTYLNAFLTDNQYVYETKSPDRHNDKNHHQYLKYDEIIDNKRKEELNINISFDEDEDHDDCASPSKNIIEVRQSEDEGEDTENDSKNCADQSEDEDKIEIVNDHDSYSQKQREYKYKNYDDEHKIELIVEDNNDDGRLNSPWQGEFRSHLNSADKGRKSNGQYEFQDESHDEDAKVWVKKCTTGNYCYIIT